MLQKVYAGSSNKAILTQMDFYRLQHKKAQIFVTSNAVIKNIFHFTVDDYNFICSSAYDNADDDDEVNCIWMKI